MGFRIFYGAAGCALLMAVAVPALACQHDQRAASDPAKCAAPAAETASPPNAPAQGGMVVGRNPETGELGLPTPEQRRELLAAEMGAAALAGKALFEVALPGAGFRIDLQGLLQDYAVATVGADGKPRFSCLHGADELQRFTAASAQPPASAPEPAHPSQWEEK
jgi:hypothetical protein